MKKTKTALILFIIFFLMQGCVFAEKCYSDVDESDWFYKNVNEMSEKGLLQGYPNGSFMPDSPISNAEFVSVVARSKGLKEENAQNSHWAGGLMQSALSASWYDWDEIPPTAQTYDSAISRQLAVKIIMNAYAPNASGDYNTQSAKIKDFSEVDGRYYTSVLAAYEKKIAYGDEKGNFNPKSSLTRAEACALISRSINLLNVSVELILPQQDNAPVVSSTVSGGVTDNGKLQVIGTQLCNQNGEAVVLRGMSSHGIQWFPQFLERASIESTRSFGANLFRVAMYSSENGYISNTQTVKQTLINAVDTAISLDMYVIIDWHILSDGNPNTYKNEARAFFAEMAERYKDNPAVLYEICNEPNGNVTWSGDVKPYAVDIISTIRSVSPDSIIIVGSPTWSQDLHEAAKDPISEKNIMYSCHFYAGTHTDWLRNRISEVMAQGIPVFVTEWGTTDSSGNGSIYPDESLKWIDFMNGKHISWANWSLCDKAETSAAIKSGADITDGITADELTESGAFAWAHFKD